MEDSPAVIKAVGELFQKSFRKKAKKVEKSS